MKRLAFVLLLVGCGVEPEVNSDLRHVTYEPIIDTDLQELVDEFQQDCPRAQMIRLKSLTWTGNVRIEERPNRIGVCYANGTIELADSFRGELNPIILKMLVYHELGHCVLNLPHSQTGIMAPALNIRANQYFMEHEQELIAGLCPQ